MSSRRRLCTELRACYKRSTQNKGSHVLGRRRYTTPIPSSATESSPLAKILRDSIKATGPIPVSRYMQWCLSHPVHGYYSQGDVFGKQGDFITSPEISQIFGELIAVWMVTRYLAAGSPKRCRLIELGPGRGTLMDDILRTLFRLPSMNSGISSIYLVENSEKMTAAQEAKLGEICKEKGISLNWVDRIDDIPESDEYNLLVAHEFFDAMPINVFEKTQEGFREVVVDLDPAFQPGLPTSSSSSGLRFTLSPNSSPTSNLLPSTSPRFAKIPLGARVEIAHDSWKIARKLGQLLGRDSTEGSASSSTSTRPGGAGLVIDYGGEQSFGQSFRAFRKHTQVDMFDAPGTADLTANVDFAYLKEALQGTGTNPLGPISQAQFLTSLGIQPRLLQLLNKAETEERKEDIRKSALRLVSPFGMGSQYQVMGLVNNLPEEEVYPFPLASATANPSDATEHEPSSTPT